MTTVVIILSILLVIAIAIIVFGAIWFMKFIEGFWRF